MKFKKLLASILSVSLMLSSASFVYANEVAPMEVVQAAAISGPSITVDGVEYVGMKDIILAIQGLNDGAEVVFGEGTFDFTVDVGGGKTASALVILANNVTLIGQGADTIIHSRSNHSGGLISTSVVFPGDMNPTPIKFNGQSTLYTTGDNTTLDGLTIMASGIYGSGSHDPKTVEVNANTGFTMKNCFIEPNTIDPGEADNGGLVYIALKDSASAEATVTDNVFKNAILQPKSNLVATGNTFDGYHVRRNAMVWLSAYTVGVPYEGFDVTLNENKFLNLTPDDTAIDTPSSSVIFIHDGSGSSFEGMVYNVNLNDNYWAGLGKTSDELVDGNVNDLISFGQFIANGEINTTISELNTLEQLISGEFVMTSGLRYGVANITISNMYLDEDFTLCSDSFLEVTTGSATEVVVGDEEEFVLEDYFTDNGIHVDIAGATVASSDETVVKYDPATGMYTALAPGEAILQLTVNGEVFDLLVITVLCELTIEFVENGVVVGSQDILVGEKGKVYGVSDLVVPPGFELVDTSWSHTLTATETIQVEVVAIEEASILELIIEYLFNGSSVGQQTLAGEADKVFTASNLTVPAGYLLEDTDWTYTLTTNAAIEIVVIKKEEPTIVTPGNPYLPGNNTISPGGNDANRTVIAPTVDNNQVTVVAEEIPFGTFEDGARYDLLEDTKFLVTNKDGKFASISIPYELKGNEKGTDLVLFHVDADGNYTLIPISFYKDGKVLGVTDKKGEFFIGKFNNAGDLKDVKDHWAREFMNFVFARGMEVDSESSYFKPDAKITRGEFVKVLASLISVDLTDYDYVVFDDVDEDYELLKYITWAESVKVVYGVGENNFAPDQYITREEMAAMMDRFVKSVFNAKITVDNETVEYLDNDSISEWAKTSVTRMQNKGLMAGRDNGSFDPKANITRAEVATLMYNYVNSVISSYIS